MLRKFAPVDGIHYLLVENGLENFALGVSNFRFPPGPGNPPGKENAVMKTDVRKTPAKLMSECEP